MTLPGFRSQSEAVPSRSSRRNHKPRRRSLFFAQSEFFQVLEDRHLLTAAQSSANITGSTLNLLLNQANQKLTISPQQAGMQFILSGGNNNTWTGSGTGLNISTSTLTSTNLTAYSTVKIWESSGVGGVSVYFGSGNSTTYSNSFNITLGDTACSSGAVVVDTNVNANFSGANSLSITADGPVKFNSGSLVSLLNGNVSITVNKPSGGLFSDSGLTLNNGTLQTTGTGLTTISARGGTGAAASYLNKGVAVINGGKIIGGTTGNLTITGYAYDGVDGGVQGQGVFVYNSDGANTSTISSNGANVSVIGYGANSTNATLSSTACMVNAGVVVGGPTTTTGTMGGTITSGGNGTVSVTGYGGTLANQSSSINSYSYGVYVNGSNATITSGGAGMVTVLGSGGGANANTTGGAGVMVNNGTITSGSNGSVSVTGTGCTTACSTFNHGVWLSGSTANIAAGPGTGTTTVVGQAGGCGTVIFNFGVYMIGGTITAFGSGDVTVTGHGSADATSSAGINLGGTLSTPVTITSNGGAVLVTGYGGGTGAGTFNSGVMMQASTITAGGLGTVTVLGYGGNNNGTGDTNYGVNVDSGGSGQAPGRITSSGGNVVVTGTGGGGTADSPVASASKTNIGVFVNQGGYITAGGNGTVNVTGYGGGRSPGATGATNYGVQVVTANTTSANTAAFSYIGSSGGAVSVTGIGGGGSDTDSASTGWYNYGVYLYQGGKITSGGNADVTVNGTGGGFGNSSTSSGVNAGVVVCTTLTVTGLGETFPTITSGGNGNVTIKGQGGGSTGSGANNYGVAVQTGGLVTSGGMGRVSITGVAGNSAIGAQNVGVYVQCTTTSNVCATVTSGGGNVVVTGTGGGNNNNYDIGVVVSSGGLITAPGTASVSVTGRGGNANGTSGSDNYGVWVDSACSTNQIRPKITSTNGTVTVTGYGGNTNTTLTNSGGSNHGVFVSKGGEISSGGTAPVTVTGNGGGLTGGTTTGNVGVYVKDLSSGSSLPARITSSDGPVTVTGYGGGTNSNGSGLNQGVNIAAGGQIITTGNGTSINITGTGGGGSAAATNHGLQIAGCTTLSNLTISSNGGPIVLNATEGTGSSSRGINTTSSAVIGDATTAGNITIVADSANLSTSTGSAINAAGSLLIAPIKPGVDVNLGCTTDSRGGPLKLSSAELGTLSAGTIQIGNSTTGNTTVSANVTVPSASNLTLVSNSTASTGISSNRTLTMGAGKTLDISALPAVNTQINGTTVQTQYGQLNVVGNLSIAGRALNLSGSYTTTAGNVFIIANATSLSGTFTGLANGSTTTLNGRTLVVNYNATSATLTDPAPLVTTQPTGSTVNAVSTASFTAAATGIPTPSVQWQVSTNGGTSYTDIPGATSTTYSFTAAGSDTGHKYHAVFTNTYGTVTTAAATLTVNKLGTTTSIASSVNPSTYGSSVTFTATISSGATGTVTFLDGTTSLGTGTISGNTATFSTSSLSVGSHSITAVYGGDSNYATSTSSAVSQTVNQASSTTTLVSSANPSIPGASVTFTATVSSGTTGTVTFYDGTTSLGTGTISGTTATLSTSSLSVGSHSITASYAGDGNYTGSTSSAVDQIVSKISTLTSLASSANPSALGDSVTFTATVTSGATGSVTFYDGATAVGTVSLGGNTATITTSSLTAGSHSITAVYSGDSTYATSTSNALTQVVAGAPLVTANPTAQTVSAGSTATFSATAIGNPVPTVQWQVSTNGGTSWANIAGATSTSYTTPATLAGNEGNQYRAVFINNLGSAVTSAAFLHVNSAPVITSQPVSVWANTGSTVTFKAAATGYPIPTVQWQINTGGGWSDITGATDTSYSTLASGNSGYQYRAVFHNGIGSDAITNPAILTIGVVATVSSTSVGWGTQTASLVDAGNGRLLPATRVNTIPWLGINKIALTLDQSIASLAAGDVSIRSAGGFTYSVTSVTGSGTSWTINLGGSGLANPDKVTVTVGSSSLANFSRRLDVLPGDVNDDGLVSSLDQMLVSRQLTGAYIVFYDIDGTGTLTTNDVTLIKTRIGNKLPA